MENLVTVAILAKDKSHCLPVYLRCLEEQTYPKERTLLYIRTNNNRDNTAEILTQWVEKVKGQYHTVYFDSSDVSEPVQRFEPHEWNAERFKVLGAIRQASVDYAREHDSHYLVVDCDNFVLPHTLETLLQNNMPVIGPLLRNTRDGSLYANYHLEIDANGYFANHKHYNTILFQEVKGIFQVPVIHCTYFIRKEVLGSVCYDDGSSRFEYVVFSDSLRKAKVTQYIDNRTEYGHLSFANTTEDLEKEAWWNDLKVSMLG